MATSKELRIQIPVQKYKYFSPVELSAAEQLMQLSESSAESATDDLCSFSTTNTPMSAYSKPLPISITEYEEEDDDEIGMKSRNQRYRLVSDLYEITSPIGAAMSRNVNKKKSDHRR